MMGSRLRRFVFLLHVVASLGWLGALVAYLVLDVTVALHDDVATLRAAYVAMALVTWWSIVPLAAASVVTGLVVSLGTRWGLFRHWWVVVTLLLTLLAFGVLLVETRTIAYHAAVAGDPSVTAAEVRALGSTLVHSVGGLVVLVAVTVLNVYKPKGLTRYGWRRQQAERIGAPSVPVR